jgi:photosystem II PsbW protein
VVAVRAQGGLQGLKAKAAAAAVTLPAMLVSSPAFALVDDRLNGDGTGKPLGINDPVLGFVIGGVFLTIWALWFNGQKDLGDFEDDNSGLSL